MIINNINIMPDASEIIHYDDAELPLYIRQGVLSSYPNYRAAAHWHEDFEFIEVEQGEMNYSVNGETVHLNEGDCLFINSRQLHFGFDESKRECIFFCMLIHPVLLCKDSPVLKKLLAPMQEDASFPCWRFTDKTQIQSLLKSIYRAKKDVSYAYQFSAIGMLSEIAGIILNIWHGRETSLVSDIPAASDPQLELQRKMVAFIEENFASELSLDAIAESACVSRSTCCRLFRKYVHTSPISFLNSYRLQVACEQLRSTDQSITDIASRCGFNHMSYFSHLFQDSYGCTPRNFRKKNRE